ncbi:MAG: sulfatase-like hydrolase/transferase [Opitutaceae bacterium]
MPCFLSAAVVGLALAITVTAAAAAAPSSVSSPPDILLLMPDQWRGDALSAVGHPVVQTPTLDRLARGGALFRRAYSTCPSCIPARQSLLTGLFPATSGLVGYAPMTIKHPTLPALLTAAGYATVLVGRNMHQNPPNKSIGYQHEFLGSTYLSDDDYDRELRAAAPGSGGIRAVIDQLGVTTNFWQAKPWPHADELHPTAWIARRSRRVIAETDAAKPLFLTASFYAPHPPLFPPKTYFDKYLAAKLPPVARGDWVQWQALSPEGDRNGHRIRLEGETLRTAQAGYFGLMEHLDAQLAPLIADFTARSDKAGRPWIIVFTTDHGEMLGDHGYFRKCEPYEGAANIPFIVAASPALAFSPGLRSAQPVCLEDIMPTLLELAGLPSPRPMDGVSLVRVLRGEKNVVRELLHSEHAATYGPEQAFHALTDGRHKYIWRPADGSEQLFDLTTDPREERDLATRSAEASFVAVWRGRMVRELSGRPEGFSDGRALLAGRPYPSVQRRGAPVSK